MNRFSMKHNLILIPILMSAFAIRVYALHLPGPYGDETLFVLPAYQMKWGDYTSPDAVLVFGHRVPLIVNAYTGALPVYAQYAFSYLTGSSWFAYRVLDVAYATGTIAVTYLFARDLFGPRVALLTALLFTFMPSSVFYSRLGEPVIFLRVLLSTLMLLFAYRWWRRGNWWYFYAACLSVGLGFSTRLEIIWWILAIGLYLGPANRRLLSEIAARMRAHRPRVLTGLAFAIAGAIPFLSYNLHSRAGTLAYVAHNLFATFYGHRTLALFRNLEKRLSLDHIRSHRVSFTRDVLYDRNGPLYYLYRIQAPQAGKEIQQR